MSKLKDVLPGIPAVKNITHKKNDDFEFPIKGYDEGDPYDFTGHSFLMQIKEKATDSESVVEIPDGSFTIGQDQEGVDAGVQNLVTINHTDDDFDIDAKEYIFDIEMTDGAGKITTILEGTFTVTQDTTRPTA